MIQVMVTRLRPCATPMGALLGVDFEHQDQSLLRFDDVDRPAGSLDEYVDRPFMALAEVDGSRVVRLKLPEKPTMLGSADW